MCRPVPTVFEQHAPDRTETPRKRAEIEIIAL